MPRPEAPAPRSSSRAPAPRRSGRPALATRVRVLHRSGTASATIGQAAVVGKPAPRPQNSSGAGICAKFQKDLPASKPRHGLVELGQRSTDISWAWSSVKTDEDDPQRVAMMPCRKYAQSLSPSTWKIFLRGERLPPGWPQQTRSGSKMPLAPYYPGRIPCGWPYGIR